MAWGSAVPMGMANRLSREKVPGHLDGLYHHGDTGVFCGPRCGAVRVGVPSRGLARDCNAAGLCGECDGECPRVGDVAAADAASVWLEVLRGL
jgi:hypothetical protein